MSAESKVNELHKIQTAAYFNCQNVLPNLTELIEYRRRIARELLKCSDDNTHELLYQTYEWVNRQIKLLLGV